MSGRWVCQTCCVCVRMCVTMCDSMCVCVCVSNVKNCTLTRFMWQQQRQQLTNRQSQRQRQRRRVRAEAETEGGLRLATKLLPHTHSQMSTASERKGGGGTTFWGTRTRTTQWQIKDFYYHIMRQQILPPLPFLLLA